MSSDAFELELIKKSDATKISVLWIEVQSPTGDFVVGPDHAPLVSLLTHKGKLLYKTYSGQEVAIDTYGGIFKVANNKAVVLLD